MKDVRDLIITHKAMLEYLSSQQSRRKEYSDTRWVDVETDVMLGHVNCDRSKRNLSNISRHVLIRHEALAAGHSDYSSKFALYCAELALGVSPIHKETKVKRPYLIVDDRCSRDYKYRLSWYLPEEEDIGGSLGDTVYTQYSLATEAPEDRDVVVAYLAAKDSPAIERDSDGFYWETSAQASAALRVVKAALKADTGAPMPEWATKALAAGWKAPKGWKP